MYCDNGGTCLNSITGRQCSCNEGFENQDLNPGLPCQDINECDVMNIDCGRGICRNNPGSYSCICFDGSTNFKNDSSLICG